MESSPLILTVGELKRNDKASVNVVHYLETRWLAFNFSCVFSRTVELIDTETYHSSLLGKTLTTCIF